MNKSDLLKVLIRYFSALIVFACIIAFIKDVIPSLILVPSLILILPFLDKWVISKIPLLGNSILKYGVAFFLFILAMKTVPDDVETPANVNQNISANLESNQGKNTYDANGNPVSTKNETEVPENKESKIIAGISPVDVYGSFEKMGFETDKDIDSEGAIFRNKHSSKGIDYNVETYCEKGVNDVTSVSLQATRMLPQYNKVADMKQFLKYGCSIPYDGYDVEKVSKFIDDNYFNDKASITISGVKFTIYCPTEFARMIVIERE